MTIGKVLKKTVLLFALIVVLTILLSSRVSLAKTYPEKPTFDNYGTHAVYSVRLTPKYWFTCDIYRDYSVADIIGKHTVAAKPLKQDEMMFFAGKYKGKYYFNRIFLDTAEAVYSWKPGQTSFKKEADGIMLDQFRKYHRKFVWGGAKIGKYVTAAETLPSGYIPRYKVYVFNLQKKTKRTLDKEVFQIRRVGKKIYYVKGIMDNKGRFNKLRVKCCSANGKHKKVVRKINYSKGTDVIYATLTKHYVKVRVNGKIKKYKYR